MTFLKDFVYSDERFKGLDFIGEDRLTIRGIVNIEDHLELDIEAHTLSSLPRTTEKICGPKYRQCKLAHVFLDVAQSLILVVTI